MFAFTAVELQAATFGFYDPRSLAMGGTGVSHANIDHAAYFNPALLSVAEEDDDFSLLIPSVGIQVYDPENLWDSIEAYQDGQYETTFNNTMDAFNTASAADKKARAVDVSTSAQQLLDGLNAMAGKELDFEVNAGLGVAVPGKRLGLAVSANGRVMGGVVLDVTAGDNLLIQKYIDTMICIASDTAEGQCHADIATDTSDPPDGIPDVIIDPSPALTSTASLRGAMLVEGGLSLSHEFESLDKLSIGITPKVVQVTTFDYKIGVENAELDSDAVDKGKRVYDDTNFDLGLAKRLDKNWKAGLMIKNVMRKEYKTVLGNTIVLEPQARAGVSHHTNWTTVALDLDLTENDRTGLTGEATRYIAIGMELDVSLFQFRAGVRRNLSAESAQVKDMLSAGLGVYIAGVHADVGIAKNDDEFAAALQLGFQF